MNGKGDGLLRTGRQTGQDKKVQRIEITLKISLQKVLMT